MSTAAVTPTNAFRTWKVVQAIFWLIGWTLLFLLLFFPSLGVALFWNVLIPIAPALLVVATGVWRNVCPLSTTSLLPDKLGLSMRKKLTSGQRNTLNLVGVIVLLLVIPLRHVLFNTSGQATAVMIIGISTTAVLFGVLFERKSGWCSGLCPVHPVEKLYGTYTAGSFTNAHCNECVKCSTPCPDSTPNMSPLVSSKSSTAKAVEYIIVGGFPGYIWGWFHVPDYVNSLSWNTFLVSFGYPLLAGAITLALFALSMEMVDHSKKKIVVSLFAASAVSIYYWFRLPMLFGLSSLKTNGVLVDLSQSLPKGLMIIITLATSFFFFWWIVFKRHVKRSWAIRPKYATA
jgi:hypothetical protein